VVPPTASRGGELVTFRPDGELGGSADESMAEDNGDLGGISKTPGNSPVGDDIEGTTAVHSDPAGTADSTGGITGGSPVRGISFEITGSLMGLSPALSSLCSN
jgi:hypothetical protein